MLTADMGLQNGKAKTLAQSMKATTSSRISTLKTRVASATAEMGLSKEQAANPSARNETKNSVLAGKNASQRAAMQQAPPTCEISRRKR